MVLKLLRYAGMRFLQYKMQRKQQLALQNAKQSTNLQGCKQTKKDANKHILRICLRPCKTD